MAEVYHFLEADIIRIGSTSGDTTEASVAGYAENVSVSLGRDLQTRTDTSGVVYTRFETSREATMSIGKLYAADVYLFDGNNVKLRFGNALGTETWQLTGAWWVNKELSGGVDDNGMAYGLEIVGRDFGTV